MRKQVQESRFPDSHTCAPESAGDVDPNRLGVVN